MEWQWRPGDSLELLKSILAPPRTSLVEWTVERNAEFADKLRPFVDGPYTLENAPPGTKALHGADLGDGYQYYHVLDDAPAITWDCLAAMNSIVTLRFQLKLGDAADQYIIQACQIKISRLRERVFNVRPLEHPAAVGQGYIDRINSVRPNRSSKEELRTNALAAIQQAQKDHPDRRDDIDYIKTRAADSLGISKRALNMRLQEK